MTYINAVKYLQTLPKTGTSLDRAKKVLAMSTDVLTQPHTIHICGADGKSSCLRMLSSILEDAGYTVYLEELDEADDDGMVANVYATKDDGNYITIAYYEDSASAKEAFKEVEEQVEAAQEALEAMGVEFELVAKQSGKMVWMGTKDAVKAAK